MLNFINVKYCTNNKEYFKSIAYAEKKKQHQRYCSKNCKCN